MFKSPTHTLLASYLKVNTRKKMVIVDYGCGEGELLEYLDRAKIELYLGFEVNSACIPISKKKWGKNKKIHFSEINRKKLPSLGEKGEVDAIFLIGVVQYLPKKDLAHVLSEAKRVLKPKGQLLISCTGDHILYSWFNIYRLFLPHFSVNRNSLLTQIRKAGLRIDTQFERGIVIAPLFSNVIVFFFDALDKIFYKTKGELGPIGRKVRQFFSSLIQTEFSIRIDYGYTLFVVASPQ